MTKYIDKNKIKEEIERRIEAHKETLKNCDSSISEMVLKGSMSAYQSLLYFLDTLEVKEADLETEVNAYMVDEMKFLSDEVGYDTLSTIAKHFFELGLKAQKGE